MRFKPKMEGPEYALTLFCVSMFALIAIFTVGNNKPLPLPAATAPLPLTADEKFERALQTSIAHINGLNDELGRIVLAVEREGFTQELVLRHTAHTNRHRRRYTNCAADYATAGDYTAAQKSLCDELAQAAREYILVMARADTVLTPQIRRFGQPKHPQPQTPAAQRSGG